MSIEHSIYVELFDVDETKIKDFKTQQRT